MTWSGSLTLYEASELTSYDLVAVSGCHQSSRFPSALLCLNKKITRGLSKEKQIKVQMCRNKKPAHIVKAVRHLVSDSVADATIVQIIRTISSKESALKSSNMQR